jgi:hypothetical protein
MAQGVRMTTSSQIVLPNSSDHSASSDASSCKIDISVNRFRKAQFGGIRGPVIGPPILYGQCTQDISIELANLQAV